MALFLHHLLVDLRHHSDDHLRFLREILRPCYIHSLLSPHESYGLRRLYSFYYVVCKFLLLKQLLQLFSTSCEWPERYRC